MPRIRTIKPETAEDEKLGAVSRDARLMFILLWTICDDHGRFRAAPVHLRSRLFGYDDDASLKDVAAWLGELATIGRVQLYEVDGERYGVVANWSKHQRIDNASKPLYPDPPVPAETPQPPPRPSASLGEPPRDEANVGGSPLDQDLDLDLDLEGTRRGEGSVSDSTPSRALVLVPPNGSSPPAKVNGYAADFETWWKAYPRKVAKLDASKAWAKAIKLVTPEQLTEALEACKRSWQAKRRTSEFIPHAATWLNGQRWEDDVSDNGSASEPRGFAGIRDALARMGAS